MPNGVKVSFAQGIFQAEGPLGKLTVNVPQEIELTQDGDTLTFSRSSDEGRIRSFHGLVRSLVFNCVTGVSQGFQKTLELRGVGYKAVLEGKSLNLQLGYSHPVKFEAPAGIAFEVEPGPPGLQPTCQNLIHVKGPSKELVGEVAANIRKLRKVEPYKGKGLRYTGEHVRRKAGKSAK